MIKVVVTGPVCAGKTTFVRALSDRESFSTDEAVTSSIGKQQTTVGLDVGVSQMEGAIVKLIGTPGQERFAYMWDILASGADGIVLLIPADRRNAIEEAEEIAPVISSSPQPPVGIGLTRCDLAEAPMASSVRRRFASLAAFIDRVDPREAAACRGLLSSLLRMIDRENSA